MYKKLYQKDEKSKEEKLCIKCSDKCWRSDVNYCKTCYKLQMFELK